MSQQWKGTNNDIIGTLTLKSSVGQCYFQVTSNPNMSQQGKLFKQGYYRKLNNLSLPGSALLSGNIQSENFAVGEIIQTTIFSEN